MKRDAVIPALLAALGTIEAVGEGQRPLAVAIGTFWAACAILCARRVAPLAMPVAVAAIYAATPLLGFDVSQSAAWVLVLPFACLSAGLHTGHRLAGLLSTIGGLGLTLAGLAWLTDFDPSPVFGLIYSVGPWATGVGLRAALDRVQRLGADAERARIERAAAAEQAATAERTRIADELHDVLAHTLAAMVVQASMASDLVERDAAAAARALQRVEHAGRDALAETGRLLRVMRDDRPAAPPSPPPPPSPPRVELVLPGVAAVIGAVEILAAGYAPAWPSVGAYWLAAAVLTLRRRAPAAMPVAVAAIGLGAGRLGANTDDPAAWLLLYGVACHAAGAYAPPRAGAASVGVSIAVMTLQMLTGDALSWDALFLIVFAIGPWGVGVALRRAYQQGRVLAAEAERARADRRHEAERAAAEERRRIARELHDVLSNGLSVMVVQAALAAELAGTGGPAGPPAEAAERAGRAALAETARLLALLRNGGRDTHPARGVADLRALADDYGRAGLGVELHVDGVGALSAGIDLSTYRIVREGLTNALKHAPGSPVQVRLARRDAELAIEVRNGRAGARPPAAISGGHGLVGLRERVTLFGGRFDAGATADGGFVVAATLPVDEAP